MIKIDISKCTGCRCCETACSFYHTGKVNNNLSRIKVLNLFEIGVDGPIVCQQCKERYCMKCPEDGLTISDYGQVIVAPTICNSCGVCVKACPIGAMELFEDILYVCDLCGGHPKCVEACTEGAITFEPDMKETVSLAEFKSETKKMNPSQKRHFYLQKQGVKLRKKWRKEYA